jgi:putative ABC transport system permease protein
MRRLLRRLWYAARFRRLDDDLADEIAFHREMKEAELAAQGLSAADAARAAQRALGNDAAARHRSRDVWIPPWLQDLSQDLRFAVRLLIKDARFSLAAIGALALGLGTTTAAFTFVDRAHFRDLPLAAPDRLVSVMTADARGRQLGVSHADARDWREASRTLSHLVTSVLLPVNVTEPSLPPQRCSGSFTSVDTFAMVGRTPILGRGFLPEDDGLEAPRVAILAHSLWQSRYGGDPSVIGREIRVNDLPTTIVGVMPPGFHFPFTTELWTQVARLAGTPATMESRRGNRGVLIFAFARLAEGITLAQAQAEMDTATARLARDHPATNAGISARLQPIDQLYWGGELGLRQMFVIVMAAVSVVLLIACVNLANLLLARAVHRSREIAVRSSLGATRPRIVRQLVVESALLAAIGAAVGLVLAVYGVSVFSRGLTAIVAEGPPPFWLDFAVDWRAFAFLAVAAAGASVLFGLAPALHISRADNGVLKRSTRSIAGEHRARRWNAVLIVSQLALTLALLTGAGLLARSFVAVYQAGRVIDPTDMITMQVALGLQNYGPPEKVRTFHRRLDEELVATPIFSSVTVASDIPLATTINAQRDLTIDGRPTPAGENPPSVAYLFIGPRYFDTLRLRLIHGREFGAGDGTSGREAAIVNQRFVSMFFPDANPIGQRIRLANPAAPDIPQPWFTIVGIAPTIPQVLFRGAAEPTVYVALAGEPAPHRFVSIIARARGERADIVAALRSAVQRVDPTLPGYSVQTMDEVVGRAQWSQRLLGTLFALLAVMALTLAAVGLYAVTAYHVQQRTSEIGLRMALGARPAQVIWLFVRRMAVQLIGGLSAGLLGAIVVGRLLAGFLVLTTPTDPLAIGGVCLLLVAVAAVAAIWPARRAARIDAAIALRADS